MNNKSNTIMANSSVSSKRSFGDGTASSRSIQRSKKSFGDGTASSRSIQRSETPSPPSSPRKSGRQRDDSDAMRGDKSHLPSLIKNSASSSSIQKRDYDDDVEMLELEHDVFSILFVSDFYSITMAYGFIVFFVQFAILVLLFYDLAQSQAVSFAGLGHLEEGEENDNRWNIPSNVTIPVALSQFLAIIVAVISQDDALKSIEAVFVADYDAAIVGEAGCRNSTRYRWYFSNFLRWFEGMMTLLIILLVVVQTDNVLDIFMNFAAIEFVSKIDNAAFQLAANGFLGHTMQRRTLRVKKIAFAKNKKRCPLLIIQTAFLVNLVGLVSILVLVRMRQNSGYYYENGAGCGTLSVTFGPETFDLTTRLQYLGNNKTNNNIDEIPHMLQYSFFNGDYVVEFFDKSNRPVYYERGMMNKKAGKFYYCEAERSWVFTIPALRDVIPGKSNCPQGWLLQSPITDALTLEDVPLSQWHVIQGSGVLGKTSTTEFSIECAECKRNSDCSLNGVCSGGACDCDDAWTGQTCNIQRPFCEELSWVEYGDSSLNYTEIGPYKILKRESTTVEVYGMPVYHHVVDEDEFRIRNVSYNIISCEDNVVLFTGRVWYSFFWCRPLEELETFHAYWSDFSKNSTVWYSAPTTSKTPSELSSEPWYRSDPGSSVEGTSTTGAALMNDQELLTSKFECVNSGCTPSNATTMNLAVNKNQCGPNGKCVPIGGGGNTSGTKCDCEGLFAGPRCEFGISSTYTSNQLEDIYAVTENSTKYPNFIQSIMTSNSALNNDFYEQYWKDAIKSFFQLAEDKGLTKDELSNELRDLFGLPALGKNKTVQT